MRFELGADDRATAWRCLEERAYQLAIDGWRPLSSAPEPLIDDDGVEWGVRGRVRRDGVDAQSIYVYASARDRLARIPLPDVTPPAITATHEYRVIEAHYGTRTAARSGVLLMHHIDEGLQVMAHRRASERAMRAFCLHPLVQEDRALAAAYPDLARLTGDPAVLALALEYRNIANATLSTRELASAADIPLSPLAEVTEMLVADKLQNWKDFVLHHRATHPRAAALDRYFGAWHDRLGVTGERARWFSSLQITPSPLPLAL